MASVFFHIYCDIIVEILENKMKDIPRTILLCILADVLNLLSAYLFCEKLHIPLFWDTIFTVAITFYFGLVPGLFTAVSYNILSVCVNFVRGFGFQPIVMLFGICGALIALVTWFFARQKDEFRISASISALYLVLIALCSSFLVILTSGIIDFIRYEYFNGVDMVAPIREFTESFVKQKFSLFASCILAQIPISFTDRLITTFAGFGVYKLMTKFLGEENWR